MKISLIIGFWALLLTGAASAQQTTAAPPASSDVRISALEQQVSALKSEVEELKAALTAAAPAPAAAQAAAVPQAAPPPAPAEVVSTQGGQIPVYGGATGLAKALNPDISVIGDFLGAVGGNPIRPVPALEMHETEVAFQSVIDPYARADFFISFGESGVNLEEGYITFTSLPAGFVARAGKMRAAFGKVNTLHNHVLPWTDRPLVTENLVGGEDGIDDAGFSVSHIFEGPKHLFLEATGQLYRGDSDELFKSFRPSDVSPVAHLHGYKDLTDNTNLDIGLSYARGHNDAASLLPPKRAEDFVTSLYGMDATLRWKPLQRSIYHSFVARSEFVWSQRQQLPVEQRAFGFYSSADYQFARRWFFGGRFDWSDRAREANLTDKGGSLVLTYWPSEFAQLRGQFRHTRYAENVDTNELRLQVQFAIGAHGAHPF